MKKQKMHVRRGDIVRAISGADAASGKTGKVLKAYPKTGRVLVEGFNFVKKHLRKSGQPQRWHCHSRGPDGGFQAGGGDARSEEIREGIRR